MNVGSILYSSALTQPITVYRQNGSWVAGVWTPGTPAAIPMRAVVSMPSGADLQQIPQGDMEKGTIQVLVPSPLTLEMTDGSATSDQIQWGGNMYRVARVWDYSTYGYVKAIATKMDATTQP